MKKLVLFALIVGSVCAPLIAQSGGGKLPVPLSAGVGVFLPIGLGGGLTGEQDGYSGEMTLSNVGFGGFAFLDAKYVEAALSFSGGSSTYEEDRSWTPSYKDKGTYTAFDISAFGKYPVAFGKFTVFPLLGLDYQIVLSRKDKDANQFEGFYDDGGEPSDFNVLWFKAGAGADFDINEKLYLRGEFLYGIRTHNKVENDAKDMFEDQFKTLGFDVDLKIPLGHGPTFKLGVGYRF